MDCKAYIRIFICKRYDSRITGTYDKRSGKPEDVHAGQLAADLRRQNHSSVKDAATAAGTHLMKEETSYDRKRKKRI